MEGKQKWNADEINTLIEAYHPNECLWKLVDVGVKLKDKKKVSITLGMNGTAMAFHTLKSEKMGECYAGNFSVNLIQSLYKCTECWYQTLGVHKIQ